jgi:hypothetical protein
MFKACGNGGDDSKPQDPAKHRRWLKASFAKTMQKTVYNKHRSKAPKPRTDKDLSGFYHRLPKVAWIVAKAKQKPKQNR